MRTLSAVEAALLNLVIKAGDTSVFNVILSDPNDDCKPLDLTQFALLQMDVKKSTTSPRIIIALNDLTPIGGLKGDAQGNLNITINNGQADVPPGAYLYDVQGVGLGQVTTILTGHFIINAHVTT